MKYEIKPYLEKILKKLKKKDPIAFKSVFKKIKEIVSSNPEHYKPLRYDMKNLKRVHPMPSFVLVFKFENEMISFMDYDHHDKIYRKYR